jgi:hypothetical protein
MLMQVLYGILVSWLELSHFTPKWGKWLTSRLGNEAVPAILEAIGAQAHVNTLVFAEQHTCDWGKVEDAMISAVDSSKAAASRVWGNYVLAEEKQKSESPAPAGLMRIDGCIVRHAPDHAHDECTDFGGNINTSGARMETKHGEARANLANCNGKFPEVDVMVRYLIRTCLVNLRNGYGTDKAVLAPGVLEWIRTNQQVRSLIDTLTVTTYAEGEVNLKDAREEATQGAISHTTSSCSKERIACCGVDYNVIDVPYFKNMQAELYARNIKPGQWHFFLCPGAPDIAVRVIRCLADESAHTQARSQGQKKRRVGVGSTPIGRCFVEVARYRICSNQPKVHGFFTRLARQTGTGIFPLDRLGRPAHVLHNCNSGTECENDAFSQVCGHSAHDYYALNTMFTK